MAKINLLPPDLGPNASVLKLINSAKKISVVIGLTFFILGTLLTGYIVFLRMNIQASAKKTQALKTSISALKSTEQSLYALKERVGKIKELQAKETQDQSLTSSGGLLMDHPGVTFSEVNTSLGKITISGKSDNINYLSDFFDNVLANDGFKSIKLTSFIFNPKSGYVFELEINLK